jgi:hypothetical protein
MVTSVIATIVDGVWVPAQHHQQPPQRPVSQEVGSNVVEFDTSRTDVEKIAAHLSQIIRVAQGLSESDARRARDLLHAASGLLMATTYLPKEDQAQLEQALRR